MSLTLSSLSLLSLPLVSENKSCDALFLSTLDSSLLEAGLGIMLSLGFGGSKCLFSLSC